MTDFTGKGTVAVLKTSPPTVLDDPARVMHLAGFESALPRSARTGLKINISWQTWYPACTSTPWQLEGAIRALRAARVRGPGGRAQRHPRMPAHMRPNARRWSACAKSIA